MAAWLEPNASRPRERAVGSNSDCCPFPVCFVVLRPAALPTIRWLRRETRMAGDNEQSDKDILDGQLFGSQRTRSILLAFTVCLLVRIDHSRCIASLAGKHYATIPSSLLSPPLLPPTTAGAQPARHWLCGLDRARSSDFTLLVLNHMPVSRPRWRGAFASGFPHHFIPPRDLVRMVFFFFFPFASSGWYLIRQVYSVRS